MMGKPGTVSFNCNDNPIVQKDRPIFQFDDLINTFPVNDPDKLPQFASRKYFPDVMNGEEDEDAECPDPDEWTTTIFPHLESSQCHCNFTLISADQERFSVHRDHLMLRSEGLSDPIERLPSGVKEFRMPFSSAILKHFIYFLYYDNLRENIPVGEIIGLLEFESKYKTVSFQIRCVATLKEKISLNVVGLIYKRARKYGLDELMETAFNFMAQHAQEFFSSHDFLLLNDHELNDLIGSDKLYAPEIDVFYAIIRWGTYVCKKLLERQRLGENRPPTPQEVQQTLETTSTRFLIRYGLLSTEEVAMSVAPSGLLSDSELVTVFTYISVPDETKFLVKTAFNTRKRVYQLRQQQQNNHQNANHPTGELMEDLYSNTSNTSNSPMQQEQIEIGAEDFQFNIHKASRRTDIENSNPPVVVVNPIPSFPNGAEGPVGTNLSPEQVATETVAQASPEKEISRRRKRGSGFSKSPSVDSIRSTRSSPRKQSEGTGKSLSSEITNSEILSPPVSELGQLRPRRSVRFSEGKSKPTASAESNDFSSDDDTIEYQLLSDKTEQSWTSYVKRWEGSKDEKQRKRKNVAGIMLKNVKIEKLYPNITMPSMKVLNLDLHLDLQDSFDRFEKLFDLRQFIFFKKLENGEEDKDTWRFEDLWNSKLKISIVINGVSMFKMNKAEKSLTISFRNDADSIMSGLESKDQLKKLNLLKTYLPPQPEEFPCNSLQDVTFFSVRTNSETELGEFLKLCRNLVDFSSWLSPPFWNGNHSGLPRIDFAHHLVSKDKLRRLALCETKLDYTHEFLREATKFNLSELYLDLCNWSPSFVNDFHHLFPQLMKVAFREGPPSKYANIGNELFLHTVSLRLMVNIFKILSINWIRVWKQSLESEDETEELERRNLQDETVVNINVSCLIDGDGDGKSKKQTNSKPKARYTSTLSPVAASDIKSLKTRFESAGIPANSVNFLMEKQSNRWKGTAFDKKEDEEYLEKMSELEFRYFKLSSFYENEQTYKNCFEFENYEARE